MDIRALLREEGCGGGIIVNRFDDDNDDLRNDSDSDNDAHESDETMQKNQKLVIREPKLRAVGNTGVKGVINDYKEAKEKMIKRLERKRIETLKHIAATTPTVKSFREEEAEKKQSNQMIDDEDDEFLKKYREYRMVELRRLLDSNKSNNFQSKVNFGKLFDVNADTFVDFVDKESPTTTIIIHLYQPHLKMCLKLNDALEDLASKYPTVKFGRMLSTEVKQSFDEIALPALLIYRNQSLEGVYLRLVDNLGYNFDVDDVEDFLTTEYASTTSVSVFQFNDDQ
jgi:hypothetical protein